MWQDRLLHCVVFTKTSEELAPHYLAGIRHDMRQTTGGPSTSTDSEVTASRSVVSRIRPILYVGTRGPRVPSASGPSLRAWASPIWACHAIPPEDVERLTAFLLARPPDLVLTHWLEDTHPDHVASVRLVIEALVHYAVAHGLEDVEASRRAFPQVWSCDTYGALGSRGAFDPGGYIGIRAGWGQKVQALP